MKVSNHRSYCSSSASGGGPDGARAGIVDPVDVVVAVVTVDVVTVVDDSVVGSIIGSVVVGTIVVGISVVSSGQFNSSLPSKQSAILSQT